MSYNEPPPPPNQPPTYGGGGGYGDQPPAYGGGQPAYGGQPAKRSGKAVAGLVLGIIGAIPCFWGCFIFSILGIVFGQLGKKEIAESGGARTGEGLAKWGVYLGIAGAALGVVYWILVATGVIDITYSGNIN